MDFIDFVKNYRALCSACDCERNCLLYEVDNYNGGLECDHFVLNNAEIAERIVKEWLAAKYPTFRELEKEWKSISPESDRVAYRNPPYFLEIGESWARYLHKEEKEIDSRNFNLDDHIPEEIAKIFGIAEVPR